MSEQLKDESVLYKEKYYHEDECMICNDCGEDVPEDFGKTIGEDWICDDCQDSKEWADHCRFESSKVCSI